MIREFKNNNSEFALISAVEDFFFFGDGMTDSINQWAINNCLSFIDKDPRIREQPLIHTQLHQDYCDLFEKLITEFLENNNLDSRELYNQLRVQIELAEMKERTLPFRDAFANVLISYTGGFDVKICSKHRQ